MEDIISKELISTVLEKDIRYVYGKDAIEIGDYIIDHNTEIAFAYLFRNKEFEDYINIHELAHKCKEWAEINYGYILCSYQCGSVGNCQIMKLDKFFSAPTEEEAIFKACQWILENKDR